MPILVVVVSSFFAYQIAELNIDTARRQQAEQFEVRRNDEARTKRANVYQGFLDAADRFAVAARTAIAECPSNCPSPSGDYQNARYEFQGSINEVYIYGSVEALRQSQSVAATLPPSLADLSGDVTIVPVADTEFRKAYRDFQMVMCREIPARPRNEC